MNIGLIIIGNEILAGKRQDKHLPFAIQALKQRKLKLSWVEMIGDDADRITDTIQRSTDDNTIVFSFGGIGATPDDITRQCAAKAYEQPIKRHPEGVEILEKRFGESAYPLRVRMVEFPEKSTLIPNPVNQIPGFSVGNHHFVPGFPSMAHPMVEWVLDNHYADLKDSSKLIEYRMRIYEAHEGEFIHVMESLMEEYPDITLSCLPSTDFDYQLEIGIEAELDVAQKATKVFENVLLAKPYKFEFLNGLKPS